jgi:hypothetical protein
MQVTPIKDADTQSRLQQAGNKALLTDFALEEQGKMYTPSNSVVTDDPEDDNCQQALLWSDDQLADIFRFDDSSVDAVFDGKDTLSIADNSNVPAGKLSVVSCQIARCCVICRLANTSFALFVLIDMTYEPLSVSEDTPVPTDKQITELKYAIGDPIPKAPKDLIRIVRDPKETIALHADIFEQHFDYTSYDGFVYVVFYLKGADNFKVSDYIKHASLIGTYTSNLVDGFPKNSVDFQVKRIDNSPLVKGFNVRPDCVMAPLASGIMQQSNFDKALIHADKFMAL